MTYILFMGDDFYAQGGWHDVGGLFPTLEEAISHVQPLTTPTWWHVVDLDTGGIVAGSVRQPYSAPELPAGVVVKSEG